MNWTELTEQQYLDAINGEIPEATTARRIKRLKEQHGSRVKGAKGRLNALAIAPIQWRRYQDAIEAKATPFDQDLYDREKQIERRERLRDIGEIPAVSEPEQRSACDADLETFITTVFPKIFHLEWCADHYALCQSLQTAVVEGGKRAVAYQRGFGKTQFCIAAIVWGILTGRLSMVMLISKNETEASQIQSGIKRRLETNKRLRELYPEICWVMNLVSKSPSRKFSYHGKPIEVKSGEMLVLPVVDGAPGSEAVIKCCGIESGSIRGSHYDRSDETTVRPKLVLVDDPQDEQSAKNPTTIDKLAGIIKGAIHGLSGPGERLAVFMPCTCIQPNDLAHRFTDRAKEPEYIGIRQAALDALPTCTFEDNRLGLKNYWDEYDKIRREDLAMGDANHARATLFYMENIEPMSIGAIVRWTARREAPSVDALQYLMTKCLADRAAFMAEFQQDPLDSTASVSYLNEDDLSQLFNGLPRGHVPPDTLRIVASIDIQEHVLYWQIVAWADQFTGYILNWGTWPDQPAGIFSHDQVSRRLGAEVARLRPGEALTWADEHEIAIRECTRWLLEPIEQDDKSWPVDCVMIDARWEKIQNVVLAIAAEDEFRGRLIPSGGQFISPNRPPMSRAPLGKTQQRIEKSLEWKLDNRGSGVYFVEFDADHFRTRIQTGLTKAAAKTKLAGRITFNGTKPSKFLAIHFASKSVTIMEGSRRVMEHWKNKPGQDQDHWLDTLVMSRVGAEHEGMRVSGEMKARPKKRDAFRKMITQVDVPIR